MAATDTSIVDLAHASDFVLGALRVQPARRQVADAAGRSEVLQPRVMQVLVALARADGAIVTRDELIQACWEGRVVGEDAINRVISHLRRLSEGAGAGSFSIETITKVGYRLHAEAAAAGTAEAARAPPAQRSALGPSLWSRSASRRALLALGVGAATTTTGGAILYRRWAAEQPSPKAVTFLEQALLSALQGTPEGQNQAIGLMQRVVADYPTFADGWGALGFTYAETAHYRSTLEAAPLRERSRHAIAEARALSPHNLYAEVAAAAVRPRRGAWLTAEHAFRAAFGQHPDVYGLLYALADVLCDVGRHGDAAPIYEFVRRRSTPSPGIYYREIMALWGANRLEETDRLLTEAISLYPTHFALWFAKVFILMYGGRADAAIAVVQDPSGRPSGIPVAQFDQLLPVLRAFASRAPDAIEAVMAAELARARRGAGYAENTIQYASALGRVDDAFATADAYYFNAGYVVPELRFTVEQGAYTPLGERQGAFLFYPSTAGMRADPRFESLVQRLGLSAYWRASGSRPDDL